MRKRYFLITALLVTTAFILTLSGLLIWKTYLSREEPKPVFLTYIGLYDPGVINDLKLEWQRSHPNVTIEYEQKSPERYFSALTAPLKQGKGPDIFWWHSGWGPELKGYLSSLPSSVFNNSTFEDIFYPIVKKDLKIGGYYRGLPLEMDGLALIYSKALLKAKKFSAPPKTWTELQQFYAPILTHASRDKILTSAVALGTTNNIFNWPEIIGLLMLQNGVNFVQSGQITIDKSLASNGDNLGVVALDFYAQFSKNKIWSTTLPDSIRAFAKGKVAMIFLGAASLADLQAEIKRQAVKIDFGVTSVPQPPSAAPVTWGSYWVNGVNLSSKHQKEAWEFAAFLASPKSLKRIFAKEVSLGMVGRPYPRTDMVKELKKNKLLYPFLLQAPYAKSWYLHSDTFDNGLNDQLIAALKKYLNKTIARRGATINNLKDLAEEARPILQKYGALAADIPER